MLRVELAILQEVDHDLTLLGLEDEELARSLATKMPRKGLPTKTRSQTPPATPVSKLDDLWFLGQHRLICGDSNVSGIVTRVLAGVKPHLLVSGPSYGVQYDPEWRKRAGVNNSDRMGKVSNDDRSDWREALVSGGAKMNQ